MTAKHLIAELHKLDPNTMIAVSTWSGGARLVTSMTGGGIFFDGCLPKELEAQAERAPKGISSDAPEIVMLNVYDPYNGPNRPRFDVEDEDDKGEVDEHLMVT